jgi:N-acetylmuramoyl-L-alanine amidase
MWRKCTLLAVCFLIVAGLGFLPFQYAEAARTAVVQGTEVLLRSSPGIAADNIVGQVSRGTRLAVVGEAGDWLQVRRSDGSTAWIAGWLVRVEEQAAAGDDSQHRVEVYVDNCKVNFPDQHPFIAPASQRTYVPLRFVSEALGAQVDWDGAKKVVIVRKGGTMVRMLVGAGTAQVNGVDVSLDAPARLVGNRTMVPLRFVSEILGAEVDWLPPEAGRPGRVLITAAGGTEEESAAGRVAVVQGDWVRLRSSPVIEDNNIVGHVFKGDRLPVVGKSDDWLKVRRADGQVAWIAGWLVHIEERTAQPQSEPEPQSSPPAASVPVPPPADQELTGSVIVQVDTIEVRSQPGNHFAAIAQATRGFRLGLVSQRGDWYQIRLPSGTLGWVEAAAVEVDLQTQVPPLPSRGDDRDPVPGTFEAEVSGNRVMITVRSAEPMRYRAFQLTGPARLVIDVEGFPLEKLPDRVLDSPVVERIRTGVVDEQFRLVCDLKQGLSHTRYRTNLSADHRTLTVELYLANSALEGRVVVLDPGHGGRDPGAIGPTDLREKDVCLAIALEAARLLRAEGAEVILTRSSDRSVELDRRAEIANQAAADVFVSIHSNANVDRAKHGISTYWWPYPDGASPGQVAARQSLAQALQAALVGELRRQDLGLYQARFVVLRATQMPSALVEVCFISNPEEERLLADRDFQDRAAAAIAGGIKAYFQNY